MHVIWIYEETFRHCDCYNPAGSFLFYDTLIYRSSERMKVKYAYCLSCRELKEKFDATLKKKLTQEALKIEHLLKSLEVCLLIYWL